jgi:hypothetical protein
MTARYAIYYAPARDAALSQRASVWLGRDAWTGAALTRPTLPGLEGLDLDAITADPRGYGFHATLKAPFELAEGQTETALLDAATDLAGRLAPFTAAIGPEALGRFIAFRPTGDTAGVDSLHDACLSAFEPFRAPLSDHDLARRRKARLTDEQDARLLRWGYPYVLNDFRFHMTLTGAVADDGVREQLLEALQLYFAADRRRHEFDAICVFRQPARDQPFLAVERFAFAAARAAAIG